MRNKTKKRARRAFKRTAKTVKRLGHSVGPVLAGIAAGFATRDVTSSNSYLEDVGKDIARLVRTIGARAAEVVHQPVNNADNNGASSISEQPTA